MLNKILRPIAQRALLKGVSPYSQIHGNKSEFDDTFKPERSWAEINYKKQRFRNAFLGINAIVLLLSVGFTYKHDLIQFHVYPKDLED